MAQNTKSTTAVVATKETIRSIAIEALLAVAKDRLAPAAARAAASRTLLESIGDIGRLQEVARNRDKAGAELSLNEIDKELERLKSRS